MELPIISPEQSVNKAIEIANEGIVNGEMPIGAVVYSGDTLIASAYTMEHELRRRVVHADLLAMSEADKVVRFDKAFQPLTLAVNIEPCLMCMGAAVTLGIKYVYYGLESPNDGAHALINSWTPPHEQSYLKNPNMYKAAFIEQR